MHADVHADVHANVHGNKACQLLLTLLHILNCVLPAAERLAASTFPAYKYGHSMAKKPCNGEALCKSATGIEGFDRITGGGLPKDRTTILLGGPGTGKTVFALQTLVNAAVLRGVPGIFICFEERPDQVVANAASFGWELPALQEQHKLYFIDARPPTDAICKGDFSLTGMLAIVDAKAAEMGAGQVVFDSIDLLLSLLEQPSLQRRESYRLRDWLAASGMTGLLTVRARPGAPQAASLQYDFLEFMADCTILLSQGSGQRQARRELRITKFRGTHFDEDGVPMTISAKGISLSHFSDQAYPPQGDLNERLSSGIASLDSLLGGGYYRQSSTWISGTPGTGKTSLAAAFVEAACARGERALLSVFDQNPAALQRNLLTVAIDLAPHLAGGILQLHSTRKLARSPVEHFFLIRDLIVAHSARCVAIDSLSVPLGLAENDIEWLMFVEQILHFCASHGVTLVCDAVPYPATTSEHHSWAQISSIVGNWIELSFIDVGDSRRRSLRISKSHGTAHSNAQHELVFASTGITVLESSPSGPLQESR